MFKTPSFVWILLCATTLVACGDTASDSPGGGEPSDTGGGGHAATTGGSGGSGATGAGTETGGGGSEPTGCSTSSDCNGDPGGPVCDPESGECVGCLADGTGCSGDEYCDPITNTCALGCASDNDCIDNGYAHCNLETERCVVCLTDDECQPGTVCSEGVCLLGCNAMHDCPNGLTCCSGQCADLSSDPTNCGACDDACESPDNTLTQCIGSMCASACLSAFSDCNGSLDDGCEWNTIQDGSCLCSPGETQSCYQGSPGTQGVGPCAAGTQTCDPSGTSWGPCVGQVLPRYEICGNGIDEDCDGPVDNVQDIDGDGWTACNGDCCEIAGQGCASPKLVNPGAFEIVNDGVNNDCDAASSDTVATSACSTAQLFTGVTASHVAQAMDICQTTTANPPLASKKWGLVSAGHFTASGVAAAGTRLTQMQNEQTAIMTGFGTGGVVPRRFNTMASIATGKARDDTDPGWVIPITGTSYSHTIPFPGAPPLSTYVNAHGGNLLPGSCGTTTCPVGTGANDSVNVRLQIRTPTNAQGFSYDFRFYSGEYQTFQCTQYNDYFLAMLTSAAPGIPADHNISFDALGRAVSVNNGFFQVCGGNGKNCGPCPNGTASLAGTGFDDVNGGSTLWLTTDVPIVPGETITLELVIFDVQDQIYDTLALLDNFRWSFVPVTLGTHQ